MSLILRELTEADEAAFMKGVEDWKGQDLVWHTFVWKPGMSYLEHLERVRKDANGIDLPKGYVPATMLYGFVDGEIVGRISIRHQLNDHLEKRGGHVGYAVAPRFRGKGYATEILKQGLDYCHRRLKLDKVLITCSDDNTPSWKMIERAGGALENKVYDDVDKEMIRRYWVDLK